MHNTTFLNYSAVHKLRELALHPFDLSIEGNLSPERVDTLVTEACGFRFLYAAERVSIEVMSTLIELAKEARIYEKMIEMQSGEVVNLIHGFPSENRPALHTATRDFFQHPNPSQRAMEATKEAKEEINKLSAFIKKIDTEDKFTDLLCIGIGGSDLGPRAHYIALQQFKKQNRNVHFISNIDPDETVLAIKGLKLEKTLVLVISKTGTTLETRSNEEFVKEYFIQEGLKPEQHFISVTGKGSPMDNPRQYLECFYIWDWVGGRYSTTSMVGGVMLSFALGFDLYWEFLKGANAMDKQALTETIDTNLPMLGALLSVWNRSFLHSPTLAIIPYSQALARYPAHIQQLEMESNGKRINQCGQPTGVQTSMVIWGEPGTNAQHSFYQFIHQGTDVVPLEFIGFKESQSGQNSTFEGTTLQEKLLSNLFAQSIALAVGQKNTNPNKFFPGNRPSHILLGKQLTPYALGALLSYYEHKVAFEGFLWGINSFDQEGVQLGKTLAQELLHCFTKSKDYPLGNAFIQQLESL